MDTKAMKRLLDHHESQVEKCKRELGGGGGGLHAQGTMVDRHGMLGNIASAIETGLERVLYPICEQVGSACKQYTEDACARQDNVLVRFSEALERMSTAVGATGSSDIDCLPYGWKQHEYPVEQRINATVAGESEAINVPNDFVPYRLTVIGAAPLSVDIVLIEVDDTKFVRTRTSADLYFVGNNFRATDIVKIIPGKPIQLSVQSGLPFDVPNVRFVFQGIKKKR